MKNILLCVGLLLFAGVSYADVYIVTAPDKSVYSISEANDAEIPSGYKLTVIKGKLIRDLAITEKFSMYNFDGGKFTLDNAKVVAKNKAEEEKILKQEKNKQARQSIITKMKGLGFTDDEIAIIVE